MIDHLTMRATIMASLIALLAITITLLCCFGNGTAAQSIEVVVPTGAENAKYLSHKPYIKPEPEYHPDPYKPKEPYHPDPYYKPEKKEPEIKICVARPPFLLSAHPEKYSITVKIQVPQKDVCYKPDKIFLHVVPVYDCGHQYCRQAGSSEIQRQYDPHVKVVTIDHLKPGTKYEITAVAFYKKLGFSEKSNQLYVKTKEHYPDPYEVSCID